MYLYSKYSVNSVLFLFSIFFVCSFLNTSEGVSCTAQYQCVAANATTNYNYGNCINNTCTCFNSYGFQGNGTAANPCRCNSTVYYGNGQAKCINCQSPSQIIYDQSGNPECVNIDECANEATQSANQKAVVTQVYTNLINPMAEAIMHNPSLILNIFSPNISGRITPVGIFSDLEGTVEYFYALAQNHVDKVYIIDMISQGTTVGVRVDIHFNFTDVGGNHQDYNLTQTGFFHFGNGSNTNLIVEYDLSILRLGQVADNASSNHTAYIMEICQVHQYYCTGQYVQYASYADCINFLTYSIPFGTFYNAMSDTVACRTIHAVLVPIRPYFHCPHIGPTGGGMCINFSYDSWYQEPYY